MVNASTQQQKAIEKIIKEKNPYADKDHILLRKDIPSSYFHPHRIFAIFFIIIAAYSLITGIYLANNSCGYQYLVLSVLGVSPLTFLFNIHIGEKISLSNFYKIYLIQAIWLLIISIVSFGFIENVVEQSYCSNMWCHPQINTATFFNHLKEKVTESQFHDICSQIQGYKQIYNNFDERLTVSVQSALKMFCFKDGNCQLTESFNVNLLIKLSKPRSLVLVSFLGIMQILLAFYWFYFSYKLKYNKITFTLYELEMIMTKKVKGPGQSHKQKQLKKGVRQDGVVEDQVSNSGKDAQNMQQKVIQNVVNDVDQLFSMNSQSTEKQEEKDDKIQKLREEKIKELMQQQKNLGESLDFVINLRRKSQQDLENQIHNMSFSQKDEDHANKESKIDDNDNTNYMFTDNLSYLNQNNMSFNLDTQNVIRQDEDYDNTILPFQPTQTRFYENPENNNTVHNFSYTNEVNDHEISMHQISPTQNDEQQKQQSDSN
ncbi:hypothetical protein ABPG74_005928 [Tetrahymena malaccensis]